MPLNSSLEILKKNFKFSIATISNFFFEQPYSILETSNLENFELERTWKSYFCCYYLFVYTLVYLLPVMTVEYIVNAYLETHKLRRYLLCT